MRSGSILAVVSIAFLTGCGSVKSSGADVSDDAHGGRVSDPCRTIAIADFSEYRLKVIDPGRDDNGWQLGIAYPRSYAPDGRPLHAPDRIDVLLTIGNNNNIEQIEIVTDNCRPLAIDRSLYHTRYYGPSASPLRKGIPGRRDPVPDSWSFTVSKPVSYQDGDPQFNSPTSFVGYDVDQNGKILRIDVHH